MSRPIQVSVSPTTSQYIIGPVLNGLSSATISMILEPLLGEAIKGTAPRIIGYTLGGKFGIQTILVAVGSYLLELWMPDTGKFSNEQNSYQVFIQEMIMDGLKIAAFEALILTFLIGWSHIGLVNLIVSASGGQVLGDAISSLGNKYIFISQWQ